MASLSRKAQLQQFSWQVLEDLVFCSKRWPRLAELAVEVLLDQQCLNPAAGPEPALEALVRF